MSEDKTTVKDLAVELNIPTKDMLRVLRELNIPAKSTMSAVLPEDLARVRERCSTAQPDQNAERRQIQPGVIVRRRRHSPTEDVDGETEVASTTPAAAPTGTATVVAAVEPVTASTEAPTSAAASVSAEASVVSAASTTPRASSPVSGETAVASGADAEPVLAGEAPEASPAAEASAAPAGEAARPATKGEKSRKRQAFRDTVPAARVIRLPGSTPDVEPEPEAAPAAVVAATPVVDAVTAAPQTAVAPEAAAAPSGDAPVTDAVRTTEAVADAAVVASATPTDSPRADAESTTSADSAATEAAKAENAAARQRRGQPAASARPEGSSAPSLLPPVTEGRSHADGDDEERRAARRRRGPEPSAPQVRVISRPDPSVAAAPRPAPSSAPARDGSGRDLRDNRDNRGAPRPAGPGGPRPGGPAGPRPAGPGAPRFGAPGGAPAGPGAPGVDGREGQSKKKRNKTRKPAEFSPDAGLSRRGDDESDMPRMRSGRRRSKSRDNRQLPAATQPIKAAKRKIRVEEAIRVADLAHQMGLKSGEIIKVLFSLGIMATINKALDIDTATVVAAEFGYEVEKSGFAEEDYLTVAESDAPETLKLRPPVVTIMGHVDHGKTSLLDAIRKTNVTSGEAGGITQHIGAYHVTTKRGEIVFLDTPGHEAFTAMRARGAQVTDLVVLVVAADDGVMEQTREAVNHSKAAGVPIMVAVNKIDKPDANPDRVLRELADIGLVPEDWGGDTVVTKVSAKSREGLDELLELLALQADILELKANPDKPAKGRIVEAKLDKGRGPVATVLIQEGTLHQGDTFVCGVYSGRVRALFNDQGRKVKEAGPSIPVEVQGFDGVPEAGDEFVCLADEKLARRIAESRAVKQRERELAKESRVTLETFLSRKADDTEALVLNLVVKSDVQGSLEAILEALKKQSTDKVRIQIVHGGTGAITESDILLASASDAIVIGFNVRPTAKVKEVAEHENVDIRFYDIIYKLVDEIKSAMAGMLAPVSREVYLGQADVREVFSVPKIGAVAGSHVSDGKMARNAGIRLLRDGVVVYTGKVASLRRFKDDVKEVLKGYECGIGLENYNDIKVGDVIEAFETVEEAATL